MSLIRNSLCLPRTVRQCTSGVLLSCRQIHSSRSALVWFGRDKKAGVEDDKADALAAMPEKTEAISKWDHLSEDEVMRIRDKSRLPFNIKGEIQCVPTWGKFKQLRQYKREYVRRYYAKYGEATGIKPGVCWGNKQEIEFQMKWEKTFYPDLKTLMENDRIDKEAVAKKLAKDRAEVLANLEKLPKAIEDFYKKFEVKKKEEQAEKAKKEKLIQEVREYLGYDIAPGDTRFQEALQKKEDEEKAVLKANKKQERAAKMMAKLAAMAEEEVQKAKETSEGSGVAKQTSPDAGGDTTKKD